MNPMSLIYLVIVIVIFLLLCYLVLYLVERVFGPIDATVKSIAGVLILLLLLLYVLQHFGVFGWR